MKSPFDTTHAGTGRASPEEIIAEARNGHMVVLVDDENRENEGYLFIPAQMATPDAINFMAKHGRGLICLALTSARSGALGLEMMPQSDHARRETAFTTSIESREDVTTGISTADRARTIAVAIDGSKGADDIVCPGPVFPIVARDGGVLVRAGHVEAAVDIAKLAGLNPSGVICEIMNADGSMARLDQLLPFARQHGLKIGTIRDLIAYRRRHDHLVEKVGDAAFQSDHGGDWRILTYRNKIDGSRSFVLKKGHVVPDQPTLARVHVVSLFDDMLGQTSPRKNMLQRAMIEIGKAGAGLIVLLVPRGGEPALTPTSEPVTDLRNYGIGAQILADLGVNEMILLSNAKRNIIGLDAYGIEVVGERAIASSNEST